jgi:hypothetical protein
MIYLIILCSVLLAITVWQKLKLISYSYRIWNIEQQADKMIEQVKREHNGMVSYDLLLKRLTEIKQHIKHG